MLRSLQNQQASVSIPFRALFFLLLLLLLFLFLVCRVIPCILCDLFDLCKPAPGLANPVSQCGSLHVPRGANGRQDPLLNALQRKSRTYTYQAIEQRPSGMPNA